MSLYVVSSYVVSSDVLSLRGWHERELRESLCDSLHDKKRAGLDEIKYSYIVNPPDV